MSTYLYWMAWNEILARIFEGFEARRNVSPPWLVNPGTGRHLKLDLLYPQSGVAVRFVGMQGKGRGRKSDWDLREDTSRDEVRKELCRQNNVQLILLDPAASYPTEQFKRIGMAMAAASQRLAKVAPTPQKAALIAQMAAARGRLETLRQRIRKVEDLHLYAELWRDREAKAVAEAQRPRPSPPPAARDNGRRYRQGQMVRHSHYGPGIVTAVETKEDEVYVSVNFVHKGERKFAASLVSDKLLPE